MFIRRQVARVRRLYDEYPRPFWILVGATFIDSLGGFLLFPFFALYVTQKFGVGMTQVGVLFGLFSVTDMIGTTIGGALTDRIGRKSLTIFGLLVSAATMLILGFVPTFELFTLAALLVGIFASVGGPARQAMVADLLPEKQRADGYGLIRVVFNISATIAPALGGLLAARSYVLLFVADAIISSITALIVFVALPETRPQLRRAGSQRPSLTSTFRGYGQALRDSLFVGFCLASILAALVYMQMNTTLGVYLRDVHGIPTQGYGYILSLNAIIVVLFQFSVTRRLRPYPPMLAMALGAVLTAVGFGLYGFVSVYPMFMLAMVIITLGEMVWAPVSQAIVADMAPEDMRGRYMAMFGFTWQIPGMVGPLLAGLILDNLDPRWLWYVAGVIGLVSTGAFLMLNRQMEARKAAVIAAAETAS